MPSIQSVQAHGGITRALVGFAVAVFVVDAGAVVGMHGNSSHGRSTPPSVSVPPPTVPPVPGSSSTSTAPTSSPTSAPATPTTITAPGPTSTIPVESGSSGGGGGSQPTVPVTTTPPATSPPTSIPASTSLPPLGTYEYATTGTQTVLGQSSNYPTPTPITVTSAGASCAESNWHPQPTSGFSSSQTTVECLVSGGFDVKSDSSTTTYEGTTQTQTFTCAPNSYIPVTGGSIGEIWTWTCTSSSSSESTTAQSTVTLDSRQSSTVGGKSVPTSTVTVDTKLSGTEKGEVNTKYTFTDSGVPVAESGTIDASSGLGSYSASYTLTLDSLTPS